MKRTKDMSKKPKAIITVLCALALGNLTNMQTTYKKKALRKYRLDILKPVESLIDQLSTLLWEFCKILTKRKLCLSYLAVMNVGLPN